MNKKSTESKKTLFSFHGIDVSIIFVACFLSIFCLIFVYSASAFEAGDDKVMLFKTIELNKNFSLLFNTAAYIILGLVVMTVLAIANFDTIGSKIPLVARLVKNPVIYYVISCSFFIFIEVMKHVGSDSGAEDGIVGNNMIIKSNGAYRWIRIPIIHKSFQPSEAVKFLLIICFALIIYNSGMILEYKRGILLYVIVAAIPSAMVLFFSSDLSSSIVIFGILYIMMLVAGPNFKNTAVATGVIFLIVLIAFLFLWRVNYGKEESDIHPYQAKRILAWLYPEEYPASADQTNQALYAIGSGGIFGEGIGNSMQKIKKLSEAQNDMIFALICEEMGLCGGLAVIILYFVMLYRMFRISVDADNLFDRMVVVGVLSHIGLQVIINICVVTRIFPNTGLPLPFISSGGSSIIFAYAELGLVLNIGKNIER